MLLVGAAAAFAVAAVPVAARDRYAQRPPVVVSPDLSAPWVIQLSRTPGRTPAGAPRPAPPDAAAADHAAAAAGPTALQTAAVRPMYTKREMQRRLDPKFLPQQVAYGGSEKPGTIVIDSGDKFLYLVMANGQARRYGVGVGKEGFGWSGVEKITRKATWPEWRPPAEMIVREREKGRILPVMMAGGAGQPARRARPLSRQHALSHPRHQRAMDHRHQCLVGLHPHAQRGRGRPVRARQGRHQGDRHVSCGGRPEQLRGCSGRPQRAARRDGSAALLLWGWRV